MTDQTVESSYSSTVTTPSAVTDQAPSINNADDVCVRGPGPAVDAAAATPSEELDRGLSEFVPSEAIASDAIPSDAIPTDTVHSSPTPVLEATPAVSAGSFGPAPPISMSKLAWLSVHELTISTIEYVHAGAVVVKEAIYGWTPETDECLAQIVAETPQTVHHPPLRTEIVTSVNVPASAAAAVPQNGRRVPLTLTVSTVVGEVEERFHDTAGAALKTINTTIEHAEKAAEDIENHVRHIVSSVTEDAKAVTSELQSAIADVAEEARVAAIKLQEDFDRALSALHAPGITREEKSRIEREIEAVRQRMRSPSPPPRRRQQQQQQVDTIAPARAETNKHPILNSIGATSEYIHDGLAAIANMVTGRGRDSTARAVPSSSSKYVERPAPTTAGESTYAQRFERATDVDEGIVPRDALNKAWEAQWATREVARDVSDSLRDKARYWRNEVERSEMITKDEDIVHHAAEAATHVVRETVDAGKDLLAGSAHDIKNAIRGEVYTNDHERALRDHHHWRTHRDHDLHRGDEHSHGLLHYHKTADEPLGKDVTELLAPHLPPSRELVQG